MSMCDSPLRNIGNTVRAQSTVFPPASIYESTCNQSDGAQLSLLSEKSLSLVQQPQDNARRIARGKAKFFPKKKTGPWTTSAQNKPPHTHAMNTGNADEGGGSGVTMASAAEDLYRLYDKYLVLWAWLGAAGGLALALLLLYAVLRRRLFVKDFNTKAVFVTGADKGLGRDLVLSLLNRGLSVYAGCHSEAGAERLKGEVPPESRLTTVVIEVTSVSSVEKAKQFIEGHLPSGQGLWALVNNAGIARGLMFDFALSDDYREVLEVNFFGTINVTEVFMPLIKASRGRVINVVSIMGRCTLAAGPYSCSKFALEAYCDGLRRSMQAFGVQVATIEPGFFPTHMTERSFWEDEIERLWQKLPADLQHDYGQPFKDKAKKVLGAFINAPPLAQWNSLSMVTRDMTHAMGARFPHTRYVIGIDAWVMWRPVSFLPDAVLDWFMCRILPYYDIAAARSRTSSESRSHSS